MAERYQYVGICGGYVCVQQDAFTLVWLLCFRGKALGLASLELGGGAALKSLHALLRSRVPWRRRSGLTLPVFGHLCLSIHRGHKVFDLRRKRVTKVFSSDVKAEAITLEIEAVKKASELSFAPNLYRWSLEERWYEEDFVPGEIGYLFTAPSSVRELYRNHLETALLRMIELEVPVELSLSDYVEQLAWHFAQLEFTKKDLDTPSVDATERYISKKLEHLRSQSDCPVELVFSHGDFSLRNILRIQSGIVVIDWEGAKHRSILCDLQNFFLTELYYKRMTDEEAAESVQSSIDSLQVRLTAASSPLSSSISNSALYRELYFVERLIVLLAGELTKHRLSVVLRSIEVFQSFEKAVMRSEMIASE